MPFTCALCDNTGMVRRSPKDVPHYCNCEYGSRLSRTDMEASDNKEEPMASKRRPGDEDIYDKALKQVASMDKEDRKVGKHPALGMPYGEDATPREGVKHVSMPKGVQPTAMTVYQDKIIVAGDDGCIYTIDQYGVVKVIATPSSFALARDVYNAKKDG